MRTEAIILKKVPIRESDELVICYTRDAGKQVYHAKSIATPRSCQRSHLDVLNHVDFSAVRGNGHHIIASAYCINAFPALKTSLPALASSFFLLECFDKLVFENETDVQLWDFLRGALETNDHAARQAGGRRGPTIGWRDLFANQYNGLMAVMGYHHQTAVEELSHAYFPSLQFFQSIVH